MSRVQPAGELWCFPWELSLVANDRSAASIFWMLTAHNSFALSRLQITPACELPAQTVAAGAFHSLH